MNPHKRTPEEKEKEKRGTPEAIRSHLQLRGGLGIEALNSNNPLKDLNFDLKTAFDDET